VGGEVTLAESNRAGDLYDQWRSNGLVARVHQEVAKNTGQRSGFGQATIEVVKGGGMKMKAKHLGSNFDDFLAEEELLAEVETVAVKRVVAYQIATLMKEKQLSKSAMARQMATSRASLDRLLDPMNESVTLQTLERAAQVLGKRLRIEFV
jgi:hypothetical protein